MGDRSRYDSKRKSSTLDSRRGDISQYENQRHHNDYRDYKRDRSYENHSESRHRKHSSDSRYSSDSRHNLKHTKLNSHNSSSSSSNRYDDKKYTLSYNRDSANYRNDRKDRSHSTSSFESAYTSTPPPAPPIEPPSTNNYQINNVTNLSKDNRMSISSFVNLKLDPRISSKPKYEEPKHNFKLLIDPTIKKGHTSKIVRYNGILAGQAPVVPKDPRKKKSKIWSIDEAELPIPVFKLDKNYIGSMPRDTVRFSNLNDNIDRKFLHELCEAYGDIKEYKVYFDPKTNRHTGTGKVVFEVGTPLQKLVSALNGRSVMGKVVAVWIEEKAPPGLSLIKQLESECAKSIYRQLEPPPPPQSFPGVQIRPIPTPGTPIISNLQRIQPIAYQDSSFSHDSGHLYSQNFPQNQPPPPPPLLSSATLLMSKNPPLPLGGTPPPPPPLMEIEDVSPTGVHMRNKIMHINGKTMPSLEIIKQHNLDQPKSPLEKAKQAISRLTTYSPVSNSSRSISPVSPGTNNGKLVENNRNKFQSVSDNESKTQLEDISPAGSPDDNLKVCDDDAMSLSSISSNEETSVEVNITQPTLESHNVDNQNVKSNAFVYTDNLMNSAFPPPPYFPHHQRQVVGRSLSNPRLPGVNWSHQYVNTQFIATPLYQNNSSQIVASMATDPMMRNLTPNNNMPFTLSNSLGMLQPQPQYNSMNTQVPRLPLQSTNSEVDTQTQQYLPAVPVVPNKLPFTFQVKAGCARDISVELKRILAKDTLKKLVEQSAFSTFEEWWESHSSSNSKEVAENGKIENLTSKLLTDKPSNVVTPATQCLKDSVETSAMLQNLFGYDRNNENRPPPASFLNSFRISRKPQTQSSLKVSRISRKRRPWPMLSRQKNKQQRLEDSEEDDDDDDGYDETEQDKENKDINEEQSEEEQFELFARRQRQTQKSGSSLYQKIYSDDSEDDDKSAYRHTDAPTDEDKDSTDSELSSETSSSETDSSEVDSDDEVEGVENTLKRTEKEANDDDSQLSDFASSVACSQDDTELEEEKFTFRSMYDEPRKRRAVQKAEERLRKSITKPKTKLSKPPQSRLKSQHSKRVVVEESETETAESSDEVAENNVTIDESLVGRKMSRQDIMETEDEEDATEDEETMKESEVEEKPPSEEELLRRLILMEHNYAGPILDSLVPNTAVLKNSTRKSKSKRDILMDQEFNLIEKKRPIYDLRTDNMNNEIIWDILRMGVDEEDLVYLKEAFQSLHKGVDARDGNGLLWTDHPVTDIPVHKSRRTKGEVKLRPHQTGCARTEGYYKIPMVEKALYLKSALRKLNILQQNSTAAKNKGQLAVGHKIKSRENRAMQRRLASSIAQEEFGSLINYNQTLKMRKKALRFAKSSIHNWGLFTCEPIPADQFVCEYVGQSIRAIVAELRERQYERNGIGSSYLFRLDMESVIDATKSGCNARFINHSCQPNCYAKVILVEGAKKIVIYSKRYIKLGEEITYDYKFPIEDDKIQCLCGAPGCRGSLN